MTPATGSILNFAPLCMRGVKYVPPLLHTCLPLPSPPISWAIGFYPLLYKIQLPSRPPHSTTFHREHAHYFLPPPTLPPLSSYYSNRRTRGGNNSQAAAAYASNRTVGGRKRQAAAASCNLCAQQALLHCSCCDRGGNNSQAAAAYARNCTLQ